MKDTADDIGNEYGVSRPTVFRDAEFSAAVDKIAEEIGEETKNAYYRGKLYESRRQHPYIQQKSGAKNLHRLKTADVYVVAT